MMAKIPQDQHGKSSSGACLGGPSACFLPASPLSSFPPLPVAHTTAISPVDLSSNFLLDAIFFCDSMLHSFQHSSMQAYLSVSALEFIGIYFQVSVLRIASLGVANMLGAAFCPVKPQAR